MKRKSRNRHRNAQRKPISKGRATRNPVRPLLKKPRQSLTRVKALAALALMRREGLSLARATRLEHIKPSTFLRHVGNAVYRSGPGKRWKPRKSDRLSAAMTILTSQGPTTAVVRGSRERTLLARYDIALRKWRGGEDGAERELLTFKGQTVAGHVLITDTNLLIQLEEAGRLDFDNLYYSIGSSS